MIADELEVLYQRVPVVLYDIGLVKRSRSLFWRCLTLVFRSWPEHVLSLVHQTLEQTAQEGLTSGLEILEIRMR